MSSAHGGGPPRGKALAGLALAALGVVYGDIGTSPLYALKECFGAVHGIEPSRENVLGVLSLIVWSMNFVVSYKYIAEVMRADNKGEGGILALLALVSGTEKKKHVVLVMLGLFGAALLYGDGIITPAISVLGALEGISYATPVFEPYVVPLTAAIIFVLFLFQRHGTARVGMVFGPVMIVWFSIIAVLGLRGILHHPSVLVALNPWYAVDFFIRDGLQGFLILGAVVLVITGGEALYADMGHFGKRPIRLAWFGLVLPALTLNYFGQAALLLEHPEAVENPFYALVPESLLYPMVVVATAAAIVASQALISGAFSLTQQAIQLGYSPRFDIHHTSAHEKGQVYIPEINWMLMFATVALVFGFRTSTNLAAAYGMAVTTTMVITTLLAFVVAKERWRWSIWAAAAVTAAFLVVDVAFFSANLIKIEHGGWFPLLVAGCVYAVMSTWHTGRLLVVRRLAEAEVPLSRFFESVVQKAPVRVPGTGVFMTGRPEGTPPILVHHLTHNKVLHEQVILLTVSIVDAPTTDPNSSIDVEKLQDGFWRVVARFGYMETPNVPLALDRARQFGLRWEQPDTTYYLAHLTLFVRDRPTLGMAEWRDKLFVFLSRNARRATNFFLIPPDRVVEIGIQLEL